MICVVRKEGGHDIYLPFSIEQVEIFKPTGTKCYVYTKHIEHTKFDIIIADTDESVLVKIKGFEVRSLPKQAKVPDVVYLSNVWEKQDILIKDEAQTDIIIFDSEDNLYKDLGDRYNCQITKVSEDELPVYPVFAKVKNY